MGRDKDRDPPEADLAYAGGKVRLFVEAPLAAGAKVMLLDEPFGALDPVTRDELREEFLALRKRLGLTAVQSGQLAAGRAYLEDAFNRRLKMVAPFKNPKDVPPAYRRDLGFSRCDLGDLELLYNCDPVAAAGYYYNAARGMVYQSDQFPLNSQFARDQAYADYRMGTACQRAAVLSRGPFASLAA